MNNQDKSLLDKQWQKRCTLRCMSRIYGAIDGKRLS